VERKQRAHGQGRLCGPPAWRIVRDDDDQERGTSNFAVVAYSEYGDYLDLLVNEIGSYSGEVLLPIEDPIVLSIHADGGSWSMSVVQ
jgi:hypothetical protein